MARVLKGIRPDDLTSGPARLLELHRRAAAAGLVSEGVDGELEIMGAAVYAQRVGKDPAALFAWLCNRQKFDNVALRDREEARELLDAYRVAQRAAEPRNGLPSVGEESGPRSLREAVAEVARRIASAPRARCTGCGSSDLEAPGPGGIWNCRACGWRMVMENGRLTDWVPVGKKPVPARVRRRRRERVVSRRLF